MFRRGKTCPRCAERLKAAAKVCRFCGCEFGEPAPAVDGASPGRGSTYALAVVGALVAAVLLAVVAANIRREDSGPALVDTGARYETLPAAESAAAPDLEELVVGSTLEWTAGDARDELLRRLGPLEIRVTKEREDEFVAPVIEVTSRGERVSMKGEMSSPTYSHQISAVQLIRGGAPVVMLQSFSGGAHCCNTIQVAGLSAGKLKVVDLGSWDGDTIGLPRDISGDGLADFQLVDNSFLYAFSSYASSRAPPLILNVRRGKVVDVSKAAAFRKLFAESMESAGAACTSGGSGDERNGACAGYVAAAARIGKLEEAWRGMVTSYDATTGWDFPTGCRVTAADTCPSGSEILFKSYPEALLHFLKRRGYVSANWLPPEHYEQSVEPQAEAAPEVETI